MEIRNNPSLRMDDSNSSSVPQQTKRASIGDSSGRFSGPLSPCDSEISVGCENDRTDLPPPSPMDLAEEVTEDEDDNGAPHSPSTSLSRRGPESPQTLSPVSVHDDESESFNYLSEDEYFRPLKRLAMSDASPPQVLTHGRRHLSSLSSPEPSSMAPSHSHHQEDSKPPRQQSPKLKHPPTLGIERIHLRRRSDGDEVNTEEEGAAEGGNESEMKEMIGGDREVQQGDQKLTGLRSFSILDILSYKPSRRKSSIPVKIVRPWDIRGEDSTPESPPSRPSHPHESQNNNHKNNNKREGQNSGRGSALDALFKMTNKTLDNLNKEDKADAVSLFNSRQPTKKKRKSRTAFTNHQIFELEKRFLYQKYLSPADRDELAQNLGLSNAQVITWFQNRRAKLKRDMEELKRDVESSKVIHSKTLLEASANVVAFLKAKELPKIHLTSLPH